VPFTIIFVDVVGWFFFFFLLFPIVIAKEKKYS